MENLYEYTEIKDFLLQLNILFKMLKKKKKRQWNCVILLIIFYSTVAGSQIKSS